MIDPKEFVSTNQDEDSLTEMGGSYGCPEIGCYEVTTSGKFDSNTRLISWVCSKGHKGSVTI